MNVVQRSKTTRTAFVLLLGVFLLVPVHGEALAVTAAKLASQIDALSADVRAAGREYDTAFWRLNETELRLERLEATLAQTESDLAWSEQVLSDRVDAMYRRDQDDLLPFLLGSASFQEMTTRMELWDRIAVQDAGIVAQTSELRDIYEVELAAIEIERDRLASDAAALRRKKDELESQLSAKRKEYDRLQAELEAAIQAEAARNRVTYTPPSSANGMTFPVAGPNYYSDTWGASRSGGRRTHKGTDLMAARGTPVVAVLPGIVYAKTSTLGGKTIWLTADNGWKFYYAHLDSWSVMSGRVQQGQVIGTVGSTGNASTSAPHLHFEIHPNGGTAVNPYPYLRAMQGY